jgi:polysaccharide biosynthesis transport protein
VAASSDAVSGGRAAAPGGAEALQPSAAQGFFRRRWWAILIPLILVTGAALEFSLLQDEEYRAETSLLFRDTGPVIASAEPEREAATNVRLLQLPALTDRVEARIGGDLPGEVDVVAEAESNLATVIAFAPSAKEAARIANLYAQEFIELREEDSREELASETKAVEEQLAELGPDELAGREGQELQTRLEELELAAAGSSAPVVQIDRAKPPSEASSPKPVQNTLIGAIVGLALGLALAIALERRDRRVRDPRFMEYVLGGPIIGRIPRSRALGRSGRATRALPAPEAEAFRTVRVNLRRQLEQQGTRSLIVTSAIPGEGKTTLAWNLARIEAASGSRVLLIEADMRRPSLARSLEANGTSGLSDLLASDEAQLQDLIRPVDFDDDGADLNGAEGGAVDVLFAGGPTANPAELLASERMQAMLEVIPDRYDLVIVDTPPTVVSDAMPILEYVGGVVVVGRLGLSTDESLIGLREQLDHLDAPTLGVVVNGDAKSSDPYPYYLSKN